LLQNPSQTNEDKLTNVRYVTSITLRNKRRDYMREKFNDTEIESKNKDTRDIN